MVSAIAKTQPLSLTLFVCSDSSAMSGLERDAGGADADKFTLKDSYGVVPRGVEKLFARMEHERAASKNNVSFGIYCSFIEVGT